MTTAAAFLASLQLTVTGVTRKFAAPPASLSTADLPALFPKGFGLSQGPLTFGAHGGWPALSADIVIACEPVGQSTQPANYALVQTMADNLDAALRAAVVGTVGKGKLSWNIKAGNVMVDAAGQLYWAVIATVEGHG